MLVYTCYIFLAINRLLQSIGSEPIVRSWFVGPWRFGLYQYFTLSWLWGGRGGESSHNLTSIWSLDWVETDGQFSKKKTKSRAAWAMSISKKNSVHLFQINRLLVKFDFHHIISLVIWIQEPDLCRRSTRHALSTRADWLSTVEMACSCVEFQQYHIPKVEW